MASTASRSETDDDRWFFGQIKSEEAFQLLMNGGGSEGTFLVRESTSSPGNYVLSFISNNGHVDILICQYWDDAFYSLITEPRKIFHGIDTLISYYYENPVGGPLGTKLCQPCFGESPPLETRLHGSSNLLHRAVSQGNLKVVTELLKSGYRKIDAKNNVGQTALHIACNNENESLVKLLLGSSASVDVRDQDGMTPLQLACRLNNVGIVKLLIEDGGANIQLRTPVTVNHRPPIPQVRLPEYYQGRITRQEAKQLLLNSDEDGRYLLRKSSRSDSEFVLSLTHNKKIYHFEIQKKRQMYFIDDGPYFKCLETLIDHYSRFCDGLPTKITTPIPPNKPLDDEQFRMIYLQDANGNPMRNETYEASEVEPLLSSANSEEMLTSEEVSSVERWLSPNTQAGHSRHKFLHKESIDSLESINNQTVPSIKSIVSASSLASPPQITNPLLINSFDSLKIDNYKSSTAMNGNKTQEVFGSIDANSLSIGNELGVGEFGSVLKGIWTSPSGDEIEVAVKTLHANDTATKENFFREAEVMMDLNHPYIVKLLGVCQGPPIAMVQELAPMGSLLNFLLDFPQQIQPDFHFKLWAAQIADGMRYLEVKHFVHRDLAARNLLLDSITLVKISDFGLSRALNTNTDYYKATEGGRWPLKWYAPESIYYGQFTNQSDVWSYGITLWEMYTYGDQPYGELTGHEVAELLEKGERLPQPTACPDRAYDIMLRCWSHNPKKRPTFKDLTSLFRASQDYVNIKPYFKKT